MWRRAKTTPQKIAVLEGFLPITADDYTKAVIYYSGDDDEFVWKKATEKLKDFPLDELKKHIDEDIPEKSALALAKYAGNKKDVSLIILLITLKKIRPEWLLTYVRIQDEEFWKTLVSHKDFIVFSFPMKDHYLSHISDISNVLAHLYEEQISYIDSEKDISPVDPADKKDKEEAEEGAETDIDEDEEVVVLDGNDMDFPDFLTTDEAFEGLSAEEAIQKKKTVAQMLKGLSVGAKVKIATTGNFEVRKILIKDPRKQIALAVLGNAKITDKEIITIASDNTAPFEIISHIANTKTLSKNYRVKVALVMNPKTPLKTAMALLDLLRMSDLKKVATSRDIPNALKMKAKKKVK